MFGYYIVKYRGVLTELFKCLGWNGSGGVGSCFMLFHVVSEWFQNDFRIVSGFQNHYS